MTYEGVDVLEVRHNMREAINESFSRLGVYFPNPTGRRAWDDHALGPLPSRSFSWTCADRVECMELREFLDARQGRRVPFWTPTYCWDLQLATDGPANLNRLTIVKAGYGQFVSGSLARRFLAIAPMGQATIYRQIVGVTTAATTETLDLDSIPGVALPAATTRISFFVLCRLAEDMTTLVWSGRDVCEAQIRFQELPREYPESGYARSPGFRVPNSYSG